MNLGSMGERTEGIRKQAQELIEQAYQRGYKAGVESCAADVNQACKMSKNDGITEGRNEAWEAARKIVEYGRIKCDVILGDGVIPIENRVDPFIRLTASEAIAKIKAYEKKQEADEIKVGDEVTYHGDTGIVTSIISDDIYVLLNDGCYMVRTSEVYLIKTGRHFRVFEEDEGE